MPPLVFLMRPDRRDQ